MPRAVSYPFCSPDDPATRLRVERVLGQGSFGLVHLAHDAVLATRVAVKVITKASVATPKSERQFRKEVTALLRLSEPGHPNIIKLYTVLEDADNMYMILEYASHGELFDYIVENSPLDEVHAAYFFRGMVSATLACHLSGVVHRDIKPENFLLDRGKYVRLSDFGFAGFQARGAGKTLKQPCGSPTYAAPEIFRGESYDESVDVWSLGVNLYVLVTGRSPWGDRASARVTRERIQMAAMNPLPLTVSSECQDLISRMVVVNAADRPPLEDVLAHPFFARAMRESVGRRKHDAFARRLSVAGGMLDIDDDTLIERVAEVSCPAGARRTNLTDAERARAVRSDEAEMDKAQAALTVPASSRKQSSSEDNVGHAANAAAEDEAAAAAAAAVPTVKAAARTGTGGSDRARRVKGANDRELMEGEQRALSEQGGSAAEAAANAAAAGGGVRTRMERANTIAHDMTWNSASATRSSSAATHNHPGTTSAGAASSSSAPRRGTDHRTSHLAARPVRGGSVNIARHLETAGGGSSPMARHDAVVSPPPGGSPSSAFSPAPPAAPSPRARANSLRVRAVSRASEESAGAAVRGGSSALSNGGQSPHADSPMASRTRASTLATHDLPGSPGRANSSSSGSSDVSETSSGVAARGGGSVAGSASSAPATRSSGGGGVAAAAAPCRSASSERPTRSRSVVSPVPQQSEQQDHYHQQQQQQQQQQQPRSTMHIISSSMSAKDPSLAYRSAPSPLRSATTRAAVKGTASATAWDSGMSSSPPISPSARSTSPGGFDGTSPQQRPTFTLPAIGASTVGTPQQNGHHQQPQKHSPGQSRHDIQVAQQQQQQQQQVLPLKATRPQSLSQGRFKEPGQSNDSLIPLTSHGSGVLDVSGAGAGSGSATGAAVPSRKAYTSAPHPRPGGKSGSGASSGTCPLDVGTGGGGDTQPLSAHRRPSSPASLPISPSGDPAAILSTPPMSVFEAALSAHADGSGGKP